MVRLIDLSYPLDIHTPPWPGNPGVTVDVLDAIPASRGPRERGRPGDPGYLNVTAFSTCTHTGTHMDAPSHFYGGSPTIESIPLSQCIGSCVLADLRRLHPRQEIIVADLASYRDALVRHRKVVLQTGWSAHWGRDDYFRDFPVLSEAVAQWLMDCGVELVGVDTPSVDREPNAAHFVLLGAKAVIVENLTNLEAVGRREFHLIVTPLALKGLEASPVRAVAVVED
jgi:arylformamidase